MDGSPSPGLPGRLLRVPAGGRPPRLPPCKSPIRPSNGPDRSSRRWCDSWIFIDARRLTINLLVYKAEFFKLCATRADLWIFMIRHSWCFLLLWVRFWVTKASSNAVRNETFRYERRNIFDIQDENLSISRSVISRQDEKRTYTRWSVINFNLFYLG